MERLTPNERAVYVLREAFGYPYAEIAGFLDLTESNCQQIHRRARQHMASGRARTGTAGSAVGGEASAPGNRTARPAPGATSRRSAGPARR